MSTQQYATELAKIGLPVFPCQADKKPYIRGGFLNRSDDLEQVRKWWDKHPDALIGYVPHDIGCVGFDVDEGGVETGRQLVAILGQPCAKMRSSKEDRFHLLYPYEGVAGNRRWAYRGGSGDIRHDKGYMIAWQVPLLYRAIKARASWPKPVPEAMVAFLQAQEPTVLDQAAQALSHAESGNRNDTLNALTFKAAKAGMDFGVISSIMCALGREIGLSNEEVDKTVGSALRGAQGQDEAQKQPDSEEPKSESVPARPRAPSDMQMARILVEEHHDHLMYVPGIGWLEWMTAKDQPRYVTGGTEGRWQESPYPVLQKAYSLCARFGKDSAGGIRAACDLARPLLHVRPDSLDTYPNLLNTPHGLIDLGNGEQMDCSPEFRITGMTRVSPDPDQKPERWLRFLEEVQPSEEVRSYLQRLAGYALTGHDREHILAFFYGTGRNGKGTFLDTLHAIMGDFAQATTSDIFTVSNQTRHREIFARMHQARLVIAEEVSQGSTWNEAVLKQITGGSPIVANKMRQDSFEFLPQFTLVITGNHKPRFRSVDPALRARLHLVPFPVFLDEAKRDRNLKQALQDEWPGILQWMVEGARIYLKSGLCPPCEVVEASEGYMDDQDLVGQFMDLFCAMEPDELTTRKALLDAFSSWYEKEGFGPHAGAGSKRELQERLNEHPGAQYTRTREGMVFRGVKLLHQEEGHVPTSHEDFDFGDLNET